MTDVSSGWRQAEPSPVTFWKQIEFPLWVLDSSSSNQGFDFLGIMVAPGMLSFAAFGYDLNKGV